MQCSTVFFSGVPTPKGKMQVRGVQHVLALISADYIAFIYTELPFSKGIPLSRHNRPDECGEILSIGRL
jgi:hypothetical protein